MGDPMESLDVRPYAQEDREAVYRIAADTAFFGEPVEQYLDDRRLFCDAFYGYYTDVEPEHGWVATANGAVAGFLMGCWDTKGRGNKFVRNILPDVARNVFAGKYRIGRRTWLYAWGLLKQTASGLIRKDPHPLDLTSYPAHLHINIDSGYRGRGLGRRLMEAYIEQLRNNGIPGVHLATTDLNAAACKLYESMGFKLLTAYPSDILNYVLEYPVEDRIYVMRLDSN